MDESLEISHQHISSRFNQELQRIHRQVLTMGGLVQEQLRDALIALSDNDGELGEAVIHRDYQVNALEVAIDEACTQVLARRQPAAGDLRLLVAVIKTITDLERIGDEAERIARMAVHKSRENYMVKHYVDIRHLGEQVDQMLRQALDAFARMDVKTALDMIHEDSKVDQEYDSIIRQLVTYMMQDPRSIPTALDIMWSARALERIGDRSRNIGEYVMYFVKGKDLRHISLQKLEQEIKI
jgi:phosphate transport system protein